MMVINCWGSNLLLLFVLLLQRDQLVEDAMLIYNWDPLYTGSRQSGKEEQDFEQIYVFGPPGNRLARHTKQSEQL